MQARRCRLSFVRLGEAWTDRERAHAREKQTKEEVCSVRSSRSERMSE